MVTRSLVIRADASLITGTGHVMRCLALAQAWQDQGGNVSFVTHETLPDGLKQRLQAENMQVITHGYVPGSREDAVLLSQSALTGSIVVVDGYHFGAEYQHWIKDSGLPLLFVDDNGHAAHYSADWVLNQNIHADESLYARREGSVKLLLGTRYTLLRREFWSWRGWQREISPIAHNILVTMGGSDSGNMTLRVFQALDALPEANTLHIKAVVGAGNPYLAELSAFAAQASTRIDLLYNVTTMPDLMAWADLAISAGGSTLWEMCMMGVPTISLVVAENQRQFNEELHRRQVLVQGDPHDIERVVSALRMDARRRDAMSERAQTLVDGFGVERVIAMLGGRRLWLRKAVQVDCERVWMWANDPVTRAASFSSEPILWENHQQWYAKVLADDHTLFFIAMDGDDQPVGQLRYALEQDVAVVSISLAPEQRGRGYGSELLRIGSERLFASTGVSCQHAFIKVDNIASQKIFMRAGFQQVTETSVKGQPAFRFDLYRS